MRTFGSLGELFDCVGETVGPGPWFPVDRSRLAAFASATGDAPGYLVLALLPALSRALYRIEGVRMAVNYGLDAVRFPAPVPVGAAVRLTARVVSVTPVEGGVQLVMSATVESDRGGDPCCLADTVTRLYP